jgi:hypothetical protein
LPIKRGDRLIMTVKGSSQPVVAVLDEFEGKVVVRQRGGVTSKRAVGNLRPDTSAAAAAAAPINASPALEEQPDLSGMRVLCPVCRETSVPAVPAALDGALHIYRVRFSCPNGHEWEAEVPQSRVAS